MAEGATVQATFAATLVDEWVRSGVRHAIVSPGSRSTPLALALADAADRGALRLDVVLDERSASFRALGVGLVSALPAVVVTTSGTAAVECHPAVVEAHHAGVPMVVCTADRPPELRDVGAPQTIDQAHLFGGAVRWFADPGVADAATASTWRSLAARAVAEAVGGARGPGPVHLNLPFREPLVGEPGALPPARPGGAAWHRVAGGPRASVELWAQDGRDPAFAGLPEGVARGVVVAGRNAGDANAVLALADATGWPVLADPLSGVRIPHPMVVSAFDAVLRHPPFADAHRPDLVVRLGEPPTSKVLSTWLAGSAAVEVVAAPHGRWVDPDRIASLVIRASPTTLCDLLAARTTAGDRDDRWAASWADAERRAAAAIDAALSRAPDPCEPAVARAVHATLPDGGVLVVASSMPVRDVEWYAVARRGVRVLANRGANGIDGVLSTAAGVALAGGAPVVALLGDLAFFHDAGALLGARRQRPGLTAVVVDNDGGGIFSFLPQAATLARHRFEALFGTPQDASVPALAEAYGADVVVATSVAAVTDAVRDVPPTGVRVVHVRTDRDTNVAVHRAVHADVAAALRR